MSPVHLVYTFCKLRGLRQATLWALGKGGCMGPACGASSPLHWRLAENLKKKKYQAFFSSVNEKWHPITPAVLHTSWLEKEPIAVSWRGLVWLRCSCQAVRSKKSSMLFLSLQAVLLTDAARMLSRNADIFSCYHFSCKLFPESLFLIAQQHIRGEGKRGELSRHISHCCVCTGRYMHNEG